MKIGLVRRGYSPTGGAEAYLLRLAAELGAKGHALTLFSDTRWPDEALRSCEPPLTLCQFAELKENGRKQRITPERFADWLRGVLTREAPDFVKDHPPDFLLSMERIHECDAYRAGDGVHAAWLERRAQFEPFWKSPLRRFSTKHRQILRLERELFTGGARCVIANSQLIKNEIIAHFATPAERIHVVHNGVPAWRDEPGLRERTRAELGLDGYVALFAGTGWERKGLRFALEAMRGVDGTLLVAGRGSQRGLPRCDRARYLGPRTAGQMRALLAAADAFVLPTIYDPFSNACLEALAAGLPVITTSANGFSEILTPGVDGEITAPGEVPALTAALAAWADPARRAATRTQRMEKGARYSIEENVARTLEIIAAGK